MLRVARRWCPSLFVAVAVVAAPWATAASESGQGLVLGTAGDGGLGWGGGAEAVELATGPEVDIDWDTTGIDAARYRSDLIRLRLEGFDGPGRLTATAASALEGTELLLDSGSDVDTYVLQIGRRGTQRWSFDEPGDYVVGLVATAPAVGGGHATARITYRVAVRGDGGDVTRIAAPVASAIPESAPRQAAGTRVVIGEGHVDMGPRFVDGEWRVQLKDDSVSPLVWRDLADLVLHARDGARVELPEDPAWAFLGSPGETVYVLPQVQQAGLVWPGWNSQDPSVLDAVPGSITWRLRGVEGPGRFVLYLAGSFGQTDVLFDTASALPQDLTIGRNTHVHGNWAFTAPGVYRLTSEMRATAGDGRALSDTRVLTIAVGDATDPNTAFPAATSSTSSTSSTSTTSTTVAGGSSSTSTTTAAGGGSSGGGGGGLGNTGAAGLATKLGFAAVLVVVGWLLLVVRRRPAL